MIKRTGHILTILLLLFGTTGLTINRHYCGTNLMNTVIYETPDNCCGGDCPACHTEMISFRITDQFESSQELTDFNAGVKTLLENKSLPIILAFSSHTEATIMDDALKDHGLKPFPTKPICAGPSTPLLQVFLF
ncbi:MAG: hypothetical protein Q8M08_07700 [Bacteroidales bacterium]|nr:hypothetical protein [Bacteroidales bacterium]